MKNIILAILLFSNLLFGFDPADLKQLKEDGDCPKCDLSYANLSGMDLSMSDFSEANLTNSTFDGAILYKTIFHKSVIGTPQASR